MFAGLRESARREPRLKGDSTEASGRSQANRQRENRVDWLAAHYVIVYIHGADCEGSRRRERNGLYTKRSDLKNQRGHRCIA